MNKITIPISKDDLWIIGFLCVIICVISLLSFAGYLLITQISFPLSLVSIPCVGLTILMVDVIFLNGELVAFLGRKNPFKFRGSNR